MNRLDLHQVVSSLAFSVDLAESSIFCNIDIVDEATSVNLSKHRFLNHARRATYVAIKIAQKISKDDLFLSNVFLATALHDIGINSDFHSVHATQSFIREHSTLGEELLNKLPVDRELP